MTQLITMAAGLIGLGGQILKLIADLRAGKISEADARAEAAAAMAEQSDKLTAAFDAWQADLDAAQIAAEGGGA